MNSTIRFIRAYPNGNHAIRADPTALGTIPASALRYCEALRTASSFGWYVFPARSVTLLFDGVDVCMQHESSWEILRSEHTADPEDWWNPHCPGYLSDKAPPFVSALSNPGYVQIWSGLLVQTKPDWSTLVRSVANTTISGQFSCFEGIVETDQYAPAPLFINLRLRATDIPITISAEEPLFQVQPIHRACYSSETLSHYDQLEVSDMSAEDWDRYSETIRSIDPASDNRRPGQYATQTRKRAKRAGATVVA